MKKMIAFFFVALLALSLFACKQSEYAVDGVFLGYEVGVSSNAPMVTFVEVTIEKGKIKGYEIDVRQGTRTKEGTEEVPEYKFTWNQKTKKELGFEYKMHYKTSGASDMAAYETWLTANNKKEWFQQAELVEAYWLANDVESLGGSSDVAIDNVAGVTIKNAYEVAAKKALENAKAGKFVALYQEYNATDPSTDLYIAEMTLTKKGAIDTLVIDTLQADMSKTAGTFAWKTQTKQQLGYEYKMHYRTSGAADMTAYKAWLTANNKLEWFEQVNLITDRIKANGFSSTAAENIPAGVTIKTAGYHAALTKLFAYAGNAVK